MLRFSRIYFTYGNSVFDVEASMMMLIGWNCLTDDITTQADLHGTLDLDQLVPEIFRSPQ